MLGPADSRRVARILAVATSDEIDPQTRVKIADACTEADGFRELPDEIRAKLRAVERRSRFQSGSNGDG